MILNCKEFDVNGQKIIMGHDRETGKRYYLKDNQPTIEVKEVTCTIFTSEENYIAIVDYFENECILFSDVENPESVRDQLKAIFWIE